TFGQGQIAIAAPIPFRTRFPVSSPIIWSKPMGRSAAAIRLRQFMTMSADDWLHMPSAFGSRCTSARIEVAWFHDRARERGRRETRACRRTDLLANLRTRISAEIDGDCLMFRRASPKSAGRQNFACGVDID